RTSRRPPMYPECQRYTLSRSFRPVRWTFSAFTITTWSPMARCGTKFGLCFPRRIDATRLAKRPRTCPSASRTNHFRSISLSFGIGVGISFLSTALSGRPDRKICNKLLYWKTRALSTNAGFVGPGTQRADRANRTRRLPCRAGAAPVRRQEVGRPRPLPPWKHIDELVVDLVGVLGTRQPEALGDPEDMGVHGDRRLVEGVRADDLSRTRAPRVQRFPHRTLPSGAGSDAEGVRCDLDPTDLEPDGQPARQPQRGIIPANHPVHERAGKRDATHADSLERHREGPVARRHEADTRGHVGPRLCRGQHERAGLERHGRPLEALELPQELVEVRGQDRRPLESHQAGLERIEPPVRVRAER